MHLRRRVPPCPSECGLNPERDATLLVADVLDLVFDLRLQVVVVHQPLAQAIRSGVRTLFVEHAAMPLGLDLFDDLRRRRGAHELQIHFRSSRHGQRHPRLVRLYASLEANARLQVALIHEGLLDPLSAVTNFKEVVAVVNLYAELFTDRGLINAGRDIDRDFCDRGLWACGPSRLRLATENGRSWRKSIR